jgi:hypothetical protein
MAAKRAAIMIGVMRRGDVSDPDMYMAGIVDVLRRYPLDVVIAVTEPGSGLPSTDEFYPTPTRVREACEAIEGPRRRIREWDARAVAQVQERARIAGDPVPTPEEVRTALAKQKIAISLPATAEPRRIAETAPRRPSRARTLENPRLGPPSSRRKKK